MADTHDAALPNSLDQDLAWLSEMLASREEIDRLGADPKATAVFIERAATILDAYARREGQPRLSGLLEAAVDEARKQSND